MSLVVSKQLTALEFSILKVLLYFDLFDHPLRFKEIVLFVDQVAESENIECALNHLQELGAVDHISDYWGLSSLSKKIKQRELKNEIAAERKKSVQRFSKIVATFPFVRAVFLTGSFSKGVMWHDSDIDFFIVTDPGKLWITKALMVMFRKMFLFDSHRNFCINYLVTTDFLVIHDRNIFTAVELATMISVFGHQIYETMMSVNQWVDQYFPMHRKFNTSKLTMDARPYQFIKTLLEGICNNKASSWLGKSFMKLSENKYRNKYHEGLSEAEFNKAIVVSPRVSKVHPLFFQKHIVVKYQERCEELLKTYSISTLDHG